MANKISSCKCKKGGSCSMCSLASVSDLGDPVKELLAKIQSLVGQMLNLSRFIIVQNEKYRSCSKSGKQCHDNSD